MRCLEHLNVAKQANDEKRGKLANAYSEVLCRWKFSVILFVKGYGVYSLVPMRGYNIILHKIYNYQCVVRQFTNQM